MLQEFESQVLSFGMFYRNNISRLNEHAAAREYAENLKALPPELKELSIIESHLTTNKQVLEAGQKDTEGELSAKKQEASALEGVSKTIADLRQKATNLNVQIQEVEKEIREIEDKKRTCDELNTQRIQLYASILKEMSSIKIFFQEILDEFENDKDEILSNLRFSAFIDLRGKTEYIQQISDRLDNRAHSQNNLESILSDTFNSIDTLFSSDENQVSESEDPDNAYIKLANEIASKTQDLRLKRSVTSSDYFNAVFKRFFDLGVEINFNDKLIDNLSMGERAIVLLKILLSLDDKPLLIDQPEEHLDNRFIFNELVPAFRSAKKKRQVLIATHNANLVVNTDAEQIIVAEPDNGLIKYSCGAIEDLNIRDKITQLLEGGELAFKKREEKYGYKF